jgi:hypothetical protein
MKRMLASLMLISPLLYTAQAQAHHPAEDIISDELWQMIDDQLASVDSPHLDLDFTMMDSVIVTTIEVETDLVDEVLTDISSINHGRLMLSTQPTDPGLTEIIVVEPVGSGESRIVYQ